MITGDLALRVQNSRKRAEMVSTGCLLSCHFGVGGGGSGAAGAERHLVPIPIPDNCPPSFGVPEAQ